MRWKSKAPKPKIGDIRIIKDFAYLPTKIGDVWVWLEIYGIEQRYNSYLNWVGDVSCKWEDYDRILMCIRPRD